MGLIFNLSIIPVTHDQYFYDFLFVMWFCVRFQIILWIVTHKCVLCIKLNMFSLLRNLGNRLPGRYTSVITCSSLKYQSTTQDEVPLEVKNVTIDRTVQIPVETSIKYLQSLAFKKTYEGNLVWVLYRRNHKGTIPPKKTRKTCIRGGKIATGNPCPICRDEYLVLHEENIELLKQFICPHTGAILSYQKTGLCQKKHQELIISIKRAYDRGIMTYDVPFRKYDYSEYFNIDN